MTWKEEVTMSGFVHTDMNGVTCIPSLYWSMHADMDDLEGGGDMDDQAELEELRSVQLTRTDLEAMYDKPPFDSEYVLLS
jgi:hypothetical protein